MLNKLILNWKKFLASFIATAFFLFFWINGPINQQVSSLSINNSFSEFALAKMVGKMKKDKSSDLLSKPTVQKSGTNGLLRSQENKSKSSGLLSSKTSSEVLNKRAKELKKRASELLKGNSNTIEIITNYALANSEIYFESSPQHDHIMGYAGPITIGLELTFDNSIKDIHIIESHETESYLRKIQQSGYFQQFEYLAFDKGHSQIDGVSGATITSQAIGKIVEEMVDEAAISLPSYASTGSELFSLEVDGYGFFIFPLSLAFIFMATNQNIKKARKVCSYLDSCR